MLGVSLPKTDNKPHFSGEWGAQQSGLEREPLAMARAEGRDTPPLTPTRIPTGKTAGKRSGRRDVAPKATPRLDVEAKPLA